MSAPEIALIGCGRIGFLLECDPFRKKPCTHYGGALGAGLSITSACDTSDERLSEFGTVAGIPSNRLFTDYRELLKTIHPDCVIIATHTDTHVSIAAEASKSGVRVIVLEKPVSPDLGKAAKLVELCRANKTNLIINHERRYDGRYRTAQKLVSGGSLGTIKTIHASILTGPYRGHSRPGEGGGPLLHDGTHLVDMIRFFAGEVSTVQGRFDRDNRSSGYEDRALAWLTTEKGIDVFLEAGGSRAYFVFELEISGTRGRLVIGNGYESISRARKSTLYRGFHDLAPAPYPRYGKTSCFINLYREVKKLLAGGNEITSTGDDGYRALEIIHAVYLSSYMGKPVNLPLDPRKVDTGRIFDIPFKLEKT